MLQAMTAPDNYANVDDQNEAFPYDAGSYPQYPPPPFHPYWPNYYPNPPYPDLYSEPTKEGSSTRSTPPHMPTPSSVQKQAPIPFWGFVPPPHYPIHTSSSEAGESESDTSSNPRTTPLPFWPYGYQQMPFEQREDSTTGEESRRMPQYPPYFDPYYFYYYHGYMPMYAPYPYYHTNDSNIDYTGYSAAETGRKSNAENNSASTLTDGFSFDIEEEKNVKELTESESDSEDSRGPVQITSTGCLKSARSVKDINIYNFPEADSDEDVHDDVSSGNSGDDTDEESSSYLVGDDILPHELSVILEVSEGRTESRIRSISVTSDSTTIADPSEDEAEEHTHHVKMPIKLCVRVGEENIKNIKNVSVESGNVKTFNDNEIYASFTLKSPSLTPKKRSPCRDYSEEGHPVHPREQFSDDEKADEDHDEVPEDIVEELDDGKESDESEDWWGILGKEDDEPKPRRTQCDTNDDAVEESKNFDLACDPSEEDWDKNNYASAKYDSDGENVHRMEGEADTISNCDEPEVKDFNEVPNEVAETTNNDDGEIDYVLSTSENTHEESKLSVKNEPQHILEASSIYNNVEDSEVDNSGKLMEMVNFVDQLKKIQESCGLWNTCTSTKTREKQLDRKVTEEGSIVGDENNVNSNDSFEKSTGTDSQNKDGADHHGEVIPGYEPTKERSADYTGYNSSTSQEVFGYNGNTPKTNITNEASYRHLDDESDSDDSSDESEYSSEEGGGGNEKEHNDFNNNLEAEVKIPSIKDRIQALKDSIKQKQERIQEHKTEIYVKEKVCSHETTAHSRTKSTSTKSSMKSFEEMSEEEEIDSGVTSDMSRHISDTEEFSELRKLTRYQRAATHSRLFKLLQEECENEDSDEENEEAGVGNKTHRDVPTNEQTRRDHLRLPLANAFDSESDVSPVNERLVGELVQSFLKRKKAQVFRNMPPEKLFAAAAKILQEEFEAYETPTSCSSFLSPLRGSTGYSTAVHTPQEFASSHEEYKQYYDSWSEAEISYDENYDILPSKAFKLLQEHSSYNKTGAIAGLLAKCPRVVSSKNVHMKLIKLLEGSEDSTAVPDKPPPNSNDVTNAS